MKWIDIKKEKPFWYTNVEIKVNGIAMKNWHRLTDGMDSIYYGSLETDEIINEDDVTHWRNLEKK